MPEKGAQKTPVAAEWRSQKERMEIRIRNRQTKAFVGVMLKVIKNGDKKQTSS